MQLDCPIHGPLDNCDQHGSDVTWQAEDHTLQLAPPYTLSTSTNSDISHDAQANHEDVSTSQPFISLRMATFQTPVGASQSEGGMVATHCVRQSYSPHANSASHVISDYAPVTESTTDRSTLLDVDGVQALPVSAANTKFPEMSNQPPQQHDSSVPKTAGSILRSQLKSKEQECVVKKDSNMIESSCTFTPITNTIAEASCVNTTTTSSSSSSRVSLLRTRLLSQGVSAKQQLSSLSIENQQGAGHHQLGAGHHQLGVGHHQLGAGHHQLGAGHHQLGAGHHQLGAVHHQLGAGHHQLVAGHHQLGASHHQLRAGHHQVGAGHPEHGATQDMQHRDNILHLSQPTDRRIQSIQHENMDRANNGHGPPNIHKQPDPTTTQSQPANSYANSYHVSVNMEGSVPYFNQATAAAAAAEGSNVAGHVCSTTSQRVSPSLFRFRPGTGDSQRIANYLGSEVRDAIDRVRGRQVDINDTLSALSQLDAHQPQSFSSEIIPDRQSSIPVVTVVSSPTSLASSSLAVAMTALPSLSSSSSTTVNSNLPIPTVSTLSEEIDRRLEHLNQLGRQVSNITQRLGQRMRHLNQERQRQLSSIRERMNTNHDYSVSERLRERHDRLRARLEDIRHHYLISGTDSDHVTDHDGAYGSTANSLSQAETELRSKS